jgi:curli biogenesis system outer membrane secretion channel CsgG
MVKKLFLAAILTGFCACAGGDSVIKKDYNWAAFKRVGVIPSKNNPRALAGVEDIFAKHLMRAGLSVIEREKIEYLLSEQKLSMDGIFAGAPDGRKPGDILGVDAILIVQVMAFNPNKKNIASFDKTDKTEEPVFRKEKEKNPDGTYTERLKQVGTKVTYRDKNVPELLGYSAQVSVTARLVDAWTGELLWVGSRNGEGSSVLSAVENSAGYLSSEFASDMKNNSVKK